MKLPYKLVLITALVFSVFDGVASAATTETNLSINDEDTFAVTAGVTYRDLSSSVISCLYISPRLVPRRYGGSA